MGLVQPNKSLLPAVPTNRRGAARKALRCAATVQLPREGARDVTLLDLSLEGLSVMSARPIAPGTRCTTHFALPLAAGAATLALSTRVVYSSYTGAQAFKVGMVLTPPDADTEAAIARFMAE